MRFYYGGYMALWLSEDLTQAKAANLRKFTTVWPPFPEHFRKLTFMNDVEQVVGPIIDGDPRLPFSERDEIRPFDGTRNYIDWLATSTRADIMNELFIDASETRHAPPTALLYQLLRHAYLSELGRSGVAFTKARAFQVFGEMPRERALANITPATRMFSVREVLEVDTSRIGVTRQPMATGDFLLAAARLPTGAEQVPEVASLIDSTEALRTLARMPTARLERCFAEHLDVCGYRVDAWIHGLFAQRLTLLRAREPEAGVNRGTYIGAYGWVEDLRPMAGRRRVVPRDTVPEPLRSELATDIVEYADSGGTIHAPSLTHAATAAVLRSAYLTHASAADPTAMSVNLASERVRMAMSYVEGLNNGQELAGLLGYQFERGLHENHGDLELDEFISVFRDYFPFVSKRITPVPDGKPAELVEARNVVDAYSLLGHVSVNGTYPYKLVGLP